jgi:hypothetical protein
MPAAKGNKYAKGNEGGRPPIFKNSKDLENKIIEYFENGVEDREFIIGSGNNKQLVSIKIPTITGLCLFCGFESRQSFYAYEKRKEFCYIVKKARLQIEKNYEEQLQYGNTTGAIFALKNMDWHDKVENEHSGEIKGQAPVILYFTEKERKDDSGNKADSSV